MRENKEKTYRNIWIIVLLVQLVLAVFLLVRFCGPKQSMTYTPAQLTVKAGSVQADGTYQITPDSGMAGNICLTTGPIALQKGVYRAEIQFDTEEEQALQVHAPSVGYHGLLCNAVSMHENFRTNHTGVTAILLQDAPDFSVDVLYTGKGILKVSSITLTHTNQEYGILLCLLVGISVLIDGAAWIAAAKRRGQLSMQSGQVICLLAAMCLLLCAPLFIDYIQLADDVYFHITRIEGIVEAWKSGQFPARMQPNWLDGMGYPVSIMYGEVFLWPSALLHLLGFDLMQSYKTGVALMNTATVIVCYFCFQDIFRSRKIGLWGTFLYTFSLYRLYNIYMRGAVGEYTAMTFLPVVVCALHGLLQRDERIAGQKKYIWILAAGYSGLLVTHVLSFEFAAVFTILTLLVFWKRTFRKVTLLHIVQAAVLAIAANLWFLVPFLDYAMHMKMLVFSNVVQIQERGMYLAQLFSVFQWAGSSAYMINNGMQDVRPFGIGCGLLLAGGIFFYLWITGRNKEQGPEWKMGKASFCFGCIACLFSLHLFPWNAIAAASKTMTKITSSIQFPYRFLVIVMITFTVTACVLLQHFQTTGSRRAVSVFVFALTAATFLQAAFLLDDVMQYKGYSPLRNAEALGSEMVSGSEYLLDGTESRMLHYNTVVCSDQVQFQDYQKKYLNVHFTCQNMGDQTGYIEPTLLYYKGYQAVDDATGQVLQMKKGTNNVMRILLPAGYSGSVSIHFTGMWYWRAADLFSLVVWTLIAVFGITIRVRKKKMKKMGEAIES